MKLRITNYELRITFSRLFVLLFLVTLPLLTPRVGASDEIEYFSYLHSVVFDHDLNFMDEYQHFCRLTPQECITSRFQETFIDKHTPTGLQINFGPIGSALLWLPFYLIAHLAALALHVLNPGILADGYSAPYIYAISFGSLLYGWIGLYLAFRLARDFVDEKIAFGAAFVILFATNAVYYLYVAPAMSHANSLFASALFVYLWYRTRAARAGGDWRAWAILGAAGALMTMVREQEAIFILIPIVESGIFILAEVLGRFGKGEAFARLVSVQPGSGPMPHNDRGKAVANASPVRNSDSLAAHPAHPVNLSRGRFASWSLQLVGLAVMGITWAVVFVPQLIVYKILNGNFLPARDVTGKFTWDGAHVGDVLFSNLHGLFSWTPVVLLAVLGLFVIWRRDRLLALAFILAFAAEVYLLGSFSTWFGGAGFGMRRFVNCTILFVVGLAFLVDGFERRIPLKVQAALGGLLIVWNLFFIVQFATGMINREQPVDFAVLAYNQVFVVPQRLWSIIWRFITARGSFYK